MDVLPLFGNFMYLILMKAKQERDFSACSFNLEGGGGGGQRSDVSFSSATNNTYLDESAQPRLLGESGVR